MTYAETQEAVLNLIRECPGISSRQISMTLGIPYDKLSPHTCVLRDRKNLIVNRGKSGRSFRWWPVTPESEDEIPYMREAQDLLEGAMSVPPAHRKRYLAEKLQELLGEPEESDVDRLRKRRKAKRRIAPPRHYHRFKR